VKCERLFAKNMVIWNKYFIPGEEEIPRWWIFRIDEIAELMYDGRRPDC